MSNPRRTRRRPARSRVEEVVDDYDDEEVEEEEEEAPRRRRTSRRGEATESKPKSRTSLSSVVKSGWDGYSKVKAENASEYVVDLKIVKEPQLIRFLEPEPAVVYSMHWDDFREGKRSFTCSGDECPLCAIGEKPRTVVVFNVLRLVDSDNDAEYTVMPIRAASRLTDKIRTANVGRNGPIDQGYWEISSNGKKGTEVQYDLLPVKDRDLKEDWGIEPLTEDELDSYYDQCYTVEELVEAPDLDILQEIADSIVDEF